MIPTMVWAARSFSQDIEEFFGPVAQIYVVKNDEEASPAGQ